MNIGEGRGYGYSIDEMASIVAPVAERHTSLPYICSDPEPPGETITIAITISYSIRQMTSRSQTTVDS